MSENKLSYAIRSAALDDLHAVVALVNDCSIAEGGRPDETPQNLLSDWSTPGFALTTDAWVAYIDSTARKWVSRSSGWIGARHRSKLLKLGPGG